ncbi:hypothetical protein [uncultured Tenacibaculum sp.]|uniref:hypothetical protein n=1 Tax=uncultured Tenacibaculum sp. TaxID=174713 RepID=UPI00263112E6|nr:hypothetical protein [uncultured Tenacibaculum sp.]
MLKGILNLDNVQALTRNEQQEIAGGRRSLAASFNCYCGFVNSEGIDQTVFTVSADSIIDALNEAGSGCGGWGATCSGVQ